MDGKQLEAVLADLIQKMGNAAQQHGPEALDLVGRYLQIKAIADIAVGAILLSCSYYAIRHFISLLRSIDDFDDRIVEGIGSIVGLFAFGIAAFIGACMFLDPGLWASAFSPKLALVQLAIDAVKK